MRTSSALKVAETTTPAQIPAALQPWLYPEAQPRRVSRTLLARQMAALSAHRLGSRLNAVVLAGGFRRGETVDIHSQQARLELERMHVLLVMNARALPPRNEVGALRADIQAWLLRQGISCELNVRMARRATA